MGYILVGEGNISKYARYTESFEYNMAPSRVYAKDCLTYASPRGDSIFGVVINQIKRKKPDGSIETLELHTDGIFDDNMTSVRFVILANNVNIVWALFTFEYWSFVN